MGGRRSQCRFDGRIERVNRCCVGRVLSCYGCGHCARPAFRDELLNVGRECCKRVRKSHCSPPEDEYKNRAGNEPEHVRISDPSHVTVRVFLAEV